MGQSFHPSLPVDQTLSPHPDRLGPIHQASGEVASPRLKGRPRPAGFPAPGGEAAETLLTFAQVRQGGDGADPGVKELVKGPRRRLVDIKHVASAGRFVSCHKPRLTRRRPPPARCRLGRVGERAFTLPPAVSPQTSHPGFPLQRPHHHPSQRDGRADTEDPVPLRGWRPQTLLRGGSLRPAARQDPLAAPSPTFVLPLPLAGHRPGTCMRKQRRHSSLFTPISTC